MLKMLVDYIHNNGEHTVSANKKYCELFMQYEKLVYFLHFLFELNTANTTIARQDRQNCVYLNACLNV
jgi:hypothetical protein